MAQNEAGEVGRDQIMQNVVYYVKNVGLFPKAHGKSLRSFKPENIKLWFGTENGLEKSKTECKESS